jgi:FKBP-type peptidyl-prolyl cis-trans isomerase 2
LLFSAYETAHTQPTFHFKPEGESVSKAKSGDTVVVHYTGTLKDGTEFDSSRGRDPLRISLGKGEVIPGFEEALLHMSAGEKKTVQIPKDKAYGERRPELVASVERDQLPPDMKPEVGQHLQLQHESGNTMHVVVAELTDTTMTIDGNHPLAGEDLTFELELVEIAQDSAAD